VSFYLDASTILPFLVEEPSTETVQEFLRTAVAPLIVSEFAAQVGQIRRLPLPPGRLHAFGVGDAVGAPSTVSATRSPNVARTTARRRSPQTYSLDDVMQQAGDGLILVAAMVEDERTNPREVREVGDVCASAKLAVVVCSSRRAALAAHSTRPQIGG
jgi:hypothetical protein